VGESDAYERYSLGRMSQQDVDTLKLGFDAVSRLDGEAMLEMMDPEVEFRPRFQVMLGGKAAVYSGHEGFREALRELYGALEWIKPEISEIRDLDGRIVALGRLRLRGKKSGVEVESPAGWVVDIKNGKAVRVSEYLDPAEALEAAGLSE
jgi:ketosteroid isomerase-like protein